MNSNAAVFGLQESGYGSPGGGYPTPTPEQLQAFYGAAVGGSTGSSGGGVASSGGDLRGGSSTTEPGSPGITSPYGLHSESRQPPPETKYEPSHSPTHTGQSGIISSDNGLQYANLDGSLADTKGYPSSGAYASGTHPHQTSYQGHHASLLQASYAHHYGKASSASLPLRSAIRKLIITLPGVCQTEHSVCQGGRKTRFGASGSRSSIQASKQPIWHFEPLIFCWLKISFWSKYSTNFKTICTVFGSKSMLSHIGRPNK